MWERRGMSHECRTSSKNMYRRAIILIIINVIGVDAFPLQFFFFVSEIKVSKNPTRGKSM